MLGHARIAAPRALASVAGILVILGAVPASGGEPGDAGVAFLKIGVGARAAAMGEAYSAVGQDATAMYWNPAGIANTPASEIHASHHEWISDVRYEYLAAMRGLKGHAFGVHAALLHMGELEGRDESGNFTESFRAYDFAAGVTYARRVARPFEVGATGKVIYSKIEDESAAGLAFDLGARYRTPVRGVTAAATMTNLGSKMKYVDAEFDLPFAMRVGVAYRTRAVLAGMVLASDLRFPNDSDAKGHLGVEIWPHEVIALRGGAKLGYDEEAGTMGVGVAYQAYLFDYAFVPFSSQSELGSTHRISVTWRPPATQPAEPQPSEPATE